MGTVDRTYDIGVAERGGGGLGKGKFFLIVIAVVMATLWGVTRDKSHGEEKHGVEAAIVVRCLDESGAYEVFVDPKSGNLMECIPIEAEDHEEIEEGGWGYRVVNRLFEEITAFIDKGETDVGTMENYVSNRGYMSFPK